MIVISSKSDKFFERHLPQTVFRSVPIRSVKSRLFLTVTPPSNHPHRDDTNYPKPLILLNFWTFRCLSLGCITRRKGIKKASCRNGTRLLVLLCFSGCQTLIRFVIFRTNVSVTRHTFCLFPLDGGLLVSAIYGAVWYTKSPIYIRIICQIYFSGGAFGQSLVRRSERIQPFLFRP